MYSNNAAKNTGGDPISLAYLFNEEAQVSQRMLMIRTIQQFRFDEPTKLMNRFKRAKEPPTKTALFAAWEGSPLSISLEAGEMDGDDVEEEESPPLNVVSLRLVGSNGSRPLFSSCRRNRADGNGFEEVAADITRP